MTFTLKSWKPIYFGLFRSTVICQLFISASRLHYICPRDFYHIGYITLLRNKCVRCKLQKLFVFRNPPSNRNRNSYNSSSIFRLLLSVKISDLSRKNASETFSGWSIKLFLKDRFASLLSLTDFVISKTFLISARGQYLWSERTKQLLIMLICHRNNH